MPDVSRWTETITRDPEHSHRFAARWRTMAAEGKDLDGEARTADALLARGSRVLDAGCGTGRVGAVLATRGHTVVGVDVDPTLIDYAQADFPGSTWLVGDLAALDLPAVGVAEPFDLIVVAGNVMGFLAPTTRLEVLRRFREHLTPHGRVLNGYAAGRGYPFDDFLADLTRAGLTRHAEFSSWDLRPFAAGSDFLVSLSGPA